MAWEEATEGERGLTVAESYWGWSCRNGMGRGYGGGARFEWTLRVAGAEPAEMALRVVELQKWHERIGGGGGYGGGVRFECTLRIAGAGDAEIAWEEATEGERGRRVR